MWYSEYAQWNSIKLISHKPSISLCSIRKNCTLGRGVWNASSLVLWCVYSQRRLFSDVSQINSCEPRFEQGCNTQRSTAFEHLNTSSHTLKTIVLHRSSSLPITQPHKFQSCQVKSHVFQVCSQVISLAFVADKSRFRFRVRFRFRFPLPRVAR